MHAQSPIHWHRHLHHASRSHILDQRHAGERAGGKGFVAVDDVLVTADEDAEDAVAEEDAGGEGAPGRNGGVGGPAHPEHADGDARGAEHREPEAEFWGKAVAACCFDAGKFFSSTDVDDGDEESGATETEADAEEGEAGQAF